MARRSRHRQSSQVIEGGGGSKDCRGVLRTGGPVGGVRFGKACKGVLRKSCKGVGGNLKACGDCKASRSGGGGVVGGGVGDGGVGDSGKVLFRFRCNGGNGDVGIVVGTVVGTVVGIVGTVVDSVVGTVVGIVGIVGIVVDGVGDDTQCQTSNFEMRSHKN